MACKNDAPNIENVSYLGALMVDIDFQDRIKKRVHLLSLLNCPPDTVNIHFDQEKIFLVDEEGEKIEITKDTLFGLPNNKILIKVVPSVISAVDSEIKDTISYLTRSKTIPAKTRQRQVFQVAELANINQRLKEANRKKKENIYLSLKDAARLSLTVSYINNLNTLEAKEEPNSDDNRQKLYEWNKLYAGLTNGEAAEIDPLENSLESDAKKVDIQGSLEKIKDYDLNLYLQLQTIVA